MKITIPQNISPLKFKANNTQPTYTAQDAKDEAQILRALMEDSSILSKTNPET